MQATVKHEKILEPIGDAVLNWLTSRNPIRPGFPAAWAVSYPSYCWSGIIKPTMGALRFRIFTKKQRNASVHQYCVFVVTVWGTCRGVLPRDIPKTALLLQRVRPPAAAAAAGVGYPPPGILCCCGGGAPPVLCYVSAAAASPQA